MGGETTSNGDQATSVIDLDRITRAMEGGEPISNEKPIVEGRSDLVENVTTFNQFNPSKESISNARCTDGERFGSVGKNQKTGKEYDLEAQKMRNEIIRGYMFKSQKVPSDLRSMSEDSIKILFTTMTKSDWFPNPNEVYMT
jgi:hypothetical protein